jgi:hypothetical protein
MWSTGSFITISTAVPDRVRHSRCRSSIGHRSFCFSKGAAEGIKLSKTNNEAATKERCGEIFSFHVVFIEKFTPPFQKCQN